MTQKPTFLQYKKQLSLKIPTKMHPSLKYIMQCLNFKILNSARWFLKVPNFLNATKKI